MQVVRYSRVESQSVATTSMDQTGQWFDSVSVTSWSMSIITEESSEGEEILSPEVPVSLLTTVYDVPVVEETLQKTGETSSEDSSADYDTAPLLDAATESVGPNLDAATESVGASGLFCHCSIAALFLSLPCSAGQLLLSQVPGKVQLHVSFKLI